MEYEIEGVKFIAIPDNEIPGGEYIQVRKHRKKRINKKYLKRYGQIYKAPYTCIKFNNGICCPESRLSEVVYNIKKDPKLLNTLILSQSKPFDGLLTRKEMTSK